MGSFFFSFFGIKESICNFGLCGSWGFFYLWLQSVLESRRLGVHLAECACVIELPELKVCDVCP
jgi:hypothetical protein